MTNDHDLILSMSPDKQFLIQQAMQELDARYDAKTALIWGEHGLHDTRESAHYALGLLLRGGADECKVASEMIGQVLNMQFRQPGELYDGTFNTALERPLPPAGYTAWGSFSPGFAYAGSDALDEVYRRFAQYSGLTDNEELAQRFRQATDEVFPRVWESFDPNWREFIASTFAVILAHFEADLSLELVQRIDEAMKLTVATSLERYRTQSIPTNTNIELMHLFITHYYGHRYGQAEWIDHAEQGAIALHNDYMELHSFAEFNSSTYYGVDLTVLGMWRTYGRTASFRSIGLALEHGLWQDIADFYHPVLENICGPFARSYENDITEHSSIGVLLYLALGESHRHLTRVNCETSHNPLIALVGVDMQEQTRAQLRSWGGERFVTHRFRELCERDLPGHNRHLCTAKAWMSERLMIGGLSGSRNTNGQMHHATAHWMTADGQRYSLRMVRRQQGQSWNTHLRGMSFEVDVETRRLHIAATFRTALPMELVFELDGPELAQIRLTPESWYLPGLQIDVDTAAAPSTLVQTCARAEIVYTISGDAKCAAEQELRFRLTFAEQ
ncbi:hypothetical protein [Paenibacillus campi]|uniref:hypothetical protein n=1 Tax=Paenibacillus campi TaxID=3106031 RepID=UPI002AFE284B|nr:hypothetical protein [Paenibacillus sp. SGZ-1009]